MKHVTLFSTLLFALTANSAYADSQCPHSYKPPKKPPVHPPVKPPVRPPSKPQTPPPCSCKGEKGDKGDPGKDGHDGKDGLIAYVTPTTVIVEKYEYRLKLSVGVMGFVADPHGDWAWGPALGLQEPLSQKIDVRLNLGLAMGASSGHQTGYMAELTAVRKFDNDRLGVFAGLHHTKIDGNSDNKNIDGSYLNLTAGLVVNQGSFRVEVGPTLGGLRDDWKDRTQFSFGGQASVFVRL